MLKNKTIYISAIIAICFDMSSKCLIDKLLEIDEIVPIINNFFYITRVSNTGAAFSSFENMRLFLILVSFIAIFLLWKIKDDFKNTMLNKIAMGILYGGIIANTIDRIILGYVRDFIKIDILNYNFPVFNFADSFIIIGSIILMIDMFRSDFFENRSRDKRE